MPADSPHVGRVLIPSSLDAPLPSPPLPRCFEDLAHLYAEERTGDMERARCIDDDVSEAMGALIEAAWKRREYGGTLGGFAYRACEVVARRMTYGELVEWHRGRASA